MFTFFTFYIQFTLRNRCEWHLDIQQNDTQQIASKKYGTKQNDSQNNDTHEQSDT
jgi:hypothetical protein